MELVSLVVELGLEWGEAATDMCLENALDNGLLMAGFPKGECSPDLRVAVLPDMDKRPRKVTIES